MPHSTVGLVDRFFVVHLESSLVALASVFAGETIAMSAFTTDKANQEFELKFTAPAGLLLNIMSSSRSRTRTRSTINSG